MYADLATNVIVESKTRGDQFSKMLVRTELVKEYITFFKERLPEAMWQLSASAGAIIALFFYDYRIALVCLAEELYKLIESKDTSGIHQFYFNMISPRTRISRWNSFSHISVKTLLVIIFVAVLFICVDVDKFSTGMIYSIVAYLWTFIAQTDYLPDLMESLGSVKDLNDRFNKDENVAGRMNLPLIVPLETPSE
jgi:hypothetical protein